MNTFVWRVLTFVGMVLLGFTVATLTVTLLLVEEIRDNTIDFDKVNFVEAASYVYVSLLGIGIIALLLMTPYLSRVTRKPESILGTGLKPASSPRAD